MKKVLLGLLALSAVSMAAAPNLGDAATAGSVIFETGQVGGISIAGKITSDIPVVKYVVYASDNDGATKEDTLNLTDFTLSQDQAVSGFVGTNPKVYVKRVVGATGAEDYGNLESKDKVSFRFDFDPSYTDILEKNWITVGKTQVTQPTKLLSKTTLQGVITALGLTNAIVNTHGNIVVDGGKHYEANAGMKIESKVNGELEIVSVPYALDANALTGAAAAAVEVGFAGGKTITNAKILVKVD